VNTASRNGRPNVTGIELNFPVNRFGAVFFVLSANACWAQGARILVGSATASPGESVSLPLMLQTGGTAISAIEWTLTYSPSDLTVLSASAGPAATQAVKSLYCNPPAPGSYTCLLFGLNSNVLVDGEIARIGLTLTAGSSTLVRLVSGNYSIASTPLGEASPIGIISGAVNLAASDTVPPAISSTIVGVTPSSATVTWITNEPASSEVLYGTSPAGLTGVVMNGSMVLTHQLEITGLLSSTTYYYRIVSADPGYNVSTWPAAGDQPSSWTTAPLPQPPSVPPGPPTGCLLNVTTAFATVAATGQDGKFTLSAPSSCAWTASSDASWAQIFPLAGSGSAEVICTVTPNFTSAIRVAHLTVGGQTFTVTQTAATGTYDQRFIGQIYFSFFGRYPTDEEVAYQIREGLAKGVSRAMLTSSFFNSGEFNAAGRFIAGLYVGLLNRDPEYGGWLFQRSALASGKFSHADLVNNFLNSAEYTQRFGNPSNQEFVRLLYRYILLREPTPAEIDFHTRSLAAGSTRGQLAAAFLASPEFAMGVEPRLTAFLLYATLLLRDPSSLERSDAIAQIAAGTPAQALIEQFISSAEFTNRLQ
jgi:hypothetical protein